MRTLLLLLAALAAACFGLPAHAAKAPSYTYVRVGNAADATPTPTPGVVLMGGSTDVDDAFKWLCARANGGDFLVIRATGTDAYNAYVKNLCPGLNSVATVIIPSRDAGGLPAVAKLITQAEAVWIAGGDQSNYINYWKGTQVQTALQARIDGAGLPVGGTSAGMNVLTPFIYSAQASKGVASSQALADPFNRYMSFERNFVNLPILAGTLGDPHFATRDRMGRDLAFLCRIVASGWSAAPRGIAVDEETALMIDERGQGIVAGAGHVYFLQTPGAPEVCQPGMPLTYEHVQVHRIGQGASFDLYQGWGKPDFGDYEVSATDGVLTSTQGGGSPY